MKQNCLCFFFSFHLSFLPSLPVFYSLFELSLIMVVSDFYQFLIVFHRTATTRSTNVRFFSFLSLPEYVVSVDNWKGMMQTSPIQL